MKMNEIKYVMRPITEKRKKEIKKRSIYDPIIDEFVKSGENLVEISVEDKRPSYVANQLQKRIETRGLEIVASTAGGFVYLEKA